MDRPPPRAGGSLLSWPLLARAYLFLGPMQAIAAMAAFFFVLGAAGWSYGEPLARLDPALFAGDHRVPRRDRRDADRQRVPLPLAALSLFTLGPFSNRLILLGVLAEVALILLIVYTALLAMRFSRPRRSS